MSLLLSKKIFYLLTGAFAASVSTAAIYQQSFDNNTGANRDLSAGSSNWSVVESQNGTTLNSNTSSFPAGGEAHDPSATGAFDAGTNGMAYVYNSNTVQESYLFYTTNLSIDPAFVTEISYWHLDLQFGGRSETRVALQIDNVDWYVNLDGFQSTNRGQTPAFANEANKETVAFDEATFGSDWANFNFTGVGNSFAGAINGTQSASGIGSIAGQEITGIGIYVYTPGTGIFEGGTIDAVQVVPEPSTYALVTGLALLSFVLVRRRARRS